MNRKRALMRPSISRRGDRLTQRARDLTAAVQESTGAPAVYLLAFGENYRHFHALIAARGDEVPENRRAGALLQLRLDSRDSEAAHRMVPDVRAAYRRIVRGREPAAVA